MNSCGALQLVSRVLSKNASSKDSVEEPVERAMIEINNTKEEDHRSPDHLESLTLQEQEQGNQVHIANASQEEMVVAPDIPSFEGILVYILYSLSNFFMLVVDISWEICRCSNNLHVHCCSL